MAKEERTYYGMFFWVAVTSFIVPLFVAYAAFDKISPTTKPTPQPDVSGVDHNLWDYLLRTYVENGLVDYDGISKDYLFATYLRQIASAKPELLSTREDKLALHCNAYNALVIHSVINHKVHRNEKNVLNFTPKDAAEKIEKLNTQIAELKRRRQSDRAEIERLTKKVDKIRSDTQFFKLKEHIFANQTISLDQLEQEMIRPVFKEPRIHVALVCAARSCPAIRAQAYIGERIEQQLQDQAQAFASDESYVAIDDESGALKLSPLLKWYKEDWDVHGGYLPWLGKLVTDPAIASKLVAAQQDPSIVQFNDYDWTLNAQSGSAGASTSGGGFGSGSVPNE